jgi:hypothetical protein
MRSARFYTASLLLLSGLFLAVAAAYGATPDLAVSSQNPPDTYSNTTYPQIVRLSLVEGDVRVMRGKEAEKASGGSAWEQAVANLPMEAGFSLVTGKGRAEIELEDASTVYLGEDSVLVFNQLTTTAGVPRTNVGLLSGVATLNIRATIPGEMLILSTPTDTISLRAPDHSLLRVNSYVDAIALTPQGNMPTRILWPTRAQLFVGPKTLTFHNGHMIVAATTPDPVASADWDAWVAKRVADRTAAMTTVMRAAGLTQPAPGLADMDGKGKFFSCEPYGMCWEPTEGWGGASEIAEEDAQGGMGTDARGATAGVSTRTDGGMRVDGTLPQDATLGRNNILSQVGPPKADDASAPAPQGATATAHTVTLGQLAAQNKAGLPAQGTKFVEVEDDFPCSPFAVRYLIAKNLVTGKQRIVRTQMYPHQYSYDWAVCHVGSWINRNHHYYWVAGHKRHHHPPIRWVKYGGTKAYVPLHPRDTKGKPPINLQHGLFATKKGDAVERVVFDQARPVKVLDEAPKEFNKPYYQPLARAEVPHPVARPVGDATLVGKEVAQKLLADRGVAGHGGTVPITFDRKTENFSISRQVVQGGKTTTVVQSFGGGPVHGAGGYSMAMANSGGRSESGSSGYARGASGGSSGGGGGSRGSSGGGSSSGGGGASHSGGGGGGGGSAGGGASSSGGGGGASAGGGGSHK